jgi:hypothetical protein
MQQVAARALVEIGSSCRELNARLTRENMERRK